MISQGTNIRGYDRGLMHEFSTPNVLTIRERQR
jgi:hypothetical protein